MEDGYVRAFEDSCRRLGVSHKRLVSYAGHSSQILSQIMPCGMIFIPSVGGVSHHPSEFSRWEDVITGVNVLLHTTLEIAGVNTP
ncbi:MAG: hypothetical protein CUN53_18550 [Phototrophicales bacterium]|nr:MAG: hypothetical protein CUN53_18550 [Phototrophicales bacterium]